ncbi:MULTISPECIES: hypothetical protein [unclassified Helicobacter]|nr:MULTISPECIES: hypothetical protein [unclassified Helicobacter]
MLKILESYIFILDSTIFGVIYYLSDAPKSELESKPESKNH